MIPFSTEGVDFAMTALFVVIAVDQWRSYRRHLPAVLGAGVTVLFLIVLGTSSARIRCCSSRWA